MSAAGYSGTPLVQKLGLKGGVRVVAMHAPKQYAQLLGTLPKGVTISSRLSKQNDFIHFFTTRENDLKNNAQRLKQSLVTDGILWVSWPKESSDMATDLNREKVRETLLETGLVDIKVCAVDETWSGLKFVYRSVDR